MRTAHDNTPKFWAGLQGFALIAALGAGFPPAAAAAESGMPVLPAASPVMAGGKDGNMKALEAQANDQVKAVVKRFGSGTDDVNLDDLNTARMAVAKLEALIDIEKRLVELDKLRNEHEGKGTLAAAIPASALTAMPMPMPTTRMAEPVRPAAMEMHASSGSVVRIIGANGNYAAIMKEGSEEKPVRIGDHLPDGSTVVNITSTSVSLMRNGAVHQVKVEGVELVSGRAY